MMATNDIAVRIHGSWVTKNCAFFEFIRIYHQRYHQRFINLA